MSFTATKKGRIRACPEARQLAMEQIDAPVFDATRAA